MFIAATSTRMRIIEIEGHIPRGQLSTYSKSAILKQEAQEGIVFLHKISNCGLKVNIDYEVFAMLNCRWPITKPSTNDIGAFAVAKIGVSLQNGMSWLYDFLGAAKWTI